MSRYTTPAAAESCLKSSALSSTGKSENPLSIFNICCFFLKEYAVFLFIMLLLLFLQLFILSISGTELKNTAYITGLTLALYGVFFCAVAGHYYLRFRRFETVLQQMERNELYDQDEDIFEYMETSFTLMEQTALLAMRNIKDENTALKAGTRRLICEQNDYFALWIHQMKTPIASLNLLLQNRNRTGDTHFQMQKALLSIENYTQMALQYLKLHGSERDLYFSPLSLDTVLQAILRKYRSFFIYKNIVLEYEPVNLTVISESVLCEVMLEQIISNSLKYCTDTGRQGCVKIYTETGSSRHTPFSGHGLPVLIIEDNGIGIAASDLPKIFDKGYSGLNGKLAEKATGLGLYLAKEIAAKINCTLTISSEYGKGTRAVIGFKTNTFDYNRN